MAIKNNFTVLLISLLSITACQGQSKTKDMNTETSKKNPLLCDTETGMCETPNEGTKELTAKDFNYLPKTTKVKLIYGTKDEYLDQNRIQLETQRAKTLFNTRVRILPFEGKHVVNIEYVNNLVEV